VHGDSRLKAQMCPFLEPNTNAQIVSSNLIHHIYCTNLWTRVDAIVTASCAVSDRESLYLLRRASCVVTKKKEGLIPLSLTLTPLGVDT